MFCLMHIFSSVAGSNPSIPNCFKVPFAKKTFKKAFQKQKKVTLNYKCPSGQEVYTPFCILKLSGLVDPALGMTLVKEDSKFGKSDHNQESNGLTEHFI